MQFLAVSSGSFGGFGSGYSLQVLISAKLRLAYIPGFTLLSCRFCTALILGAFIVA
jgi:hypothetical protein